MKIILVLDWCKRNPSPFLNKGCWVHAKACISFSFRRLYFVLVACCLTSHSLSFFSPIMTTPREFFSCETLYADARKQTNHPYKTPLLYLWRGNSHVTFYRWMFVFKIKKNKDTQTLSFLYRHFTSHVTSIKIYKTMYNTASPSSSREFGACSMLATWTHINQHLMLNFKS